MLRICRLLALLALLNLHLDFRAVAKETPEGNPAGWGYVRGRDVQVVPKPGHRGAGLVLLQRGALVGLWKWQSKQGTRWAQVHVVNLENLKPVDGWIDTSQIDELPLDKFPSDAELKRMLGGDFLEDYTASHTQITRFLVQQGSASPALVCFVVSPLVTSARLVAFLSVSGKPAPGPALEFPAADIYAGITSLEVRDLLGEGDECLITREPFRVGPETRGVNEVIRRIEGSHFQTLWKAPVEFRNLDAYPARMQILQPPEKNIGQPGTVAKGEVTFLQHGSIYEPAWKGKVEFHVLGREQPVESVPLEKVCPWDGEKFRPIQ
jgi:hypothetical protein